MLTEGKRDSETGEVRKTRLLVFGEDFTAFFKLLARDGRVYSGQSAFGGDQGKAAEDLGEEK